MSDLWVWWINVILVNVVQVPVYKEPIFTIPGTPGIVQHEILNNRRHVLTKVNHVDFLICYYDEAPVLS